MLNGRWQNLSVLAISHQAGFFSGLAGSDTMVRHVLFLIALAAPAGAQTPATSLERLRWLGGCWSDSRPDGLTEEHWMKPSGGTMLGMSRAVRGGRTTEFEFLQIREVAGKLAYVARPSGQAEATFPLKVLSDTEVVFEDPAHDFPQRIIYRRNADDSLTARIEGTKEGKTRGIDYPFKRCQ
jgi:Domain of unknown function (DUF6265)